MPENNQNQQLFAEIDSNARDCNCNPTKKQIKAGNYKKGHIELHGMKLAIETPRNSHRKGKDKHGKKWDKRMNSHYGDITGTIGADGDALDVFVGFYPESEKVFVINQNRVRDGHHEKTGKYKWRKGDFDEHKIMLGFPDWENAKSAYLMSYMRGWKGIGSMVETSVDQLKWWAFNGNTKIPLERSALPYGNIMNTDIEWSLDTGLPLNTTIKAILDDIKNSDGGDLLCEPLLLSDLLDDSEAEVLPTLDGIIAGMNTIKGKMAGMKRSMNAAGNALEVTDVIVSDPFKRMGTAQVSVEFKLSDGQSVWAFFHNPDLTPSKIEKGDELISWKWLLNKRDVTIIAAPEKGKEMPPKIIAQRLIALAEKNTKAFAKNNAKAVEKIARIAELKDTLIPEAEKELAGLGKKIEQAEFNKSQSEIKKAEQDQEKRYEDYTIEDLPNLKLNQLRKLAKIKFGAKTLGVVTRDIAEDKVRILFAEAEAAYKEGLEVAKIHKEPYYPDGYQIKELNNGSFIVEKKKGDEWSEVARDTMKVKAELLMAQHSEANDIATAPKIEAFDIENRIKILSKELKLQPMLDGMRTLLADLEKSGDYDAHKDNSELHDFSDRITKLQADDFSSRITKLQAEQLAGMMN